MDALQIAQRLHQHRTWVNRQLLAAVRDMPTEKLHQTFAIGQGTIWKTLTHLYAAEFVWLAALQGDASPVAPGDVAGRLPGNQEAEGAMASLAELMKNWDDLTSRWQTYLATLTEESLDEPVTKISSITGATSATRRGDVLLHVCTHAQYTTAQLINMLRHTGAQTLPDVMLITLARSEPQKDEKSD